ncbi:MAG: DUF5666 domain-containing protein [Flavisolibacter sp.]
MVGLLIFLSGFEVIRVETISGVVEKINQDSKFIVVDKARILVSAETKIVDEKGNILSIQDLNLDHSVQIEGVHRSNGFSATKILVKTPKKRP